MTRSYIAKLAEAGIDPSRGIVDENYDSALAETINGLYKAENIHWSNLGDPSRPLIAV